MKKTIALFALVLCILAGLVSGSLALYTKDIENFSDGSVIAKKFALTAARSEGYEDNMLIAPGETVNTKFTVSNYEGSYISEVKIALEITVALKAANEKNAIPYIKAELYDSEGNKLGTIENGVGVMTCTINEPLSAKEKDTRTFELRFHWESNTDDIKYQGPNYGNMFTVKVTGTQSV